MEKRPCTNVCGVLVSFHEVMKLKAFFESNTTPTNTQHISSLLSSHTFVNLMKKKPSSKFNGVFDHFSQIYEVRKFQMIKLCLDVSDVIHANEHT